MSDVQIVVVDEGSSQAKVCWIEEGKIKTLVIPSRVVHGFEIDAKGKTDSNYRVDGSKYHVTANTRDALPTKNQLYQISKHNRALIHEALRLAGFGGKKLKVFVTLPIDMFYVANSSERNDELIQAKKDNVMGDIEHVNNKPLAEIVECVVVPESMPAWGDYSYNDDFEDVEKYFNAFEVMIVDSGGTTTDLSIIDGYGKIKRKTSVPSGVFDVANKLEAEIRLQDPDIASIPPVHMDNLLRTHEYAGNNYTALIKQVSTEVWESILYKMSEFNANPKSLDYILYVGGGAAVFGKYLSEFYKGNTLIADNPDLAVARGLLKMAEVERQEQAETA